MNASHQQLPKYQKGAVTLLITVLIMIAMTIGSVGMLSSTRMETNMTLNDQNHREALQAAQAGIDFFTAHMGSSFIYDEKFTNSLCEPSNWRVLPSNSDPSTSEETPNSLVFLLNFSGPENGSINFDKETQSETCKSTPHSILTQAPIWVQGFSNDGTSTRILSSLVDLSSAWNHSTPSSIGSTSPGDGSISMCNGDLTFGEDNDVGFCDANDCDKIPLQGNQQSNSLVNRQGTLFNFSSTAGFAGRNENSPAYAELMNRFGQNIAQGNSPITKEDCFLDNTGNSISRQDFIATAGKVTQGRGNRVIVPPGKSNLIVDGDLRLNAGTQIGTPSSPVTIMVRGNLRANGAAVIYGTVYVVGDDSTNANPNRTINGTFNIRGRLISETNLTMSGNASVYSNATSQAIASDLDPSTSLDIQDVNRSANVRIGTWREIFN